MHIHIHIFFQFFLLQEHCRGNVVRILFLIHIFLVTLPFFSLLFYYRNIAEVTPAHPLSHTYFLNHFPFFFTTGTLPR